METTYGFLKVATAVPRLRVADCTYNAEQIKGLMRQAFEAGAQVVVFPEMCLTAYTCLDLFAQQTLLDKAQEALLDVVAQTASLDLLTMVGLPLVTEDRLINAAVVFHKGVILGVVPKTYLPNYKEFQELRWFSSAADLRQDTVLIGGQPYPCGSDLLFQAGPACIGVEICEDLWTPVPPSSLLALSGANILCNLSASNELIGKHNYLRSLVSQQSARCIAGYVYVSCGFGESSTDLVFAGNGLIAENGKILAEAPRFTQQEQLVISEIDLEHLQHDRLVDNSFAAGARSLTFRPRVVEVPRGPVVAGPRATGIVAEASAAAAQGTAVPGADATAFVSPDAAVSSHPFVLTRPIDPTPFIPSGAALDDRCEEILHIQVAALSQRLAHVHAKTAVLGISGGLDSTLALLVTVMTFDALQWPRSGVIGITMPGFGTTSRTYRNAVALIHALGVTFREISIKAACLQHFQDIGQDPEVCDVTYENSQARERTQVLMDVANKEGGLVIGTGDLSELALGWATYNGDHMSMYAVNTSIPKTLVRDLVRWAATHKIAENARAILGDIIDTPISPELTPADAQGRISQKTEDLVGPYELHDFFLYHFLRFGTRPAKIFFLAQQAFGTKYDCATLKKWLYTFFYRFFQQQFKRSCLPDGPKVGSISLSPRGDWRMPSDASARLWLEEVQAL